MSATESTPYGEAPGSRRADTDSAAPKSALRSVYVRFVPAEGARLRRSEPTRCPGGPPLWTERPILMKRADGAYELIGTSRNLEGLARWILSFGPDAEVQSPDALRHRVVAEARAVVQQYEDDGRIQP